MSAGDNFGIHRGPIASKASNEERTQGQILSDFLSQLEDYTPTVRRWKYIFFFFSLKSSYFIRRFQMQ